MDFYGLGFNAFKFSPNSVTVDATDCTVTALTPLDNLFTASLGEVCRLSVTQTGPAPRFSLLPALPPTEQRRVQALLAVSMPLGGGPWGISEFGASLPLVLVKNPSVRSVAMRSNSYFSFSPQFPASGSTSIIDIGRLWFSDVAQMTGGPWESWSDSAQDSGSYSETPGFSALFGSQKVREIVTVPIQYLSLEEAYIGLPSPLNTPGTGFASLRKARKVAGVSSHILGGRFEQLPNGSAYSHDELVGANRLTYGRLIEMPPLSRLTASYFGTELKIGELF
jgi:hypothetical protein